MNCVIPRLSVDGCEEALRREQTRVQEFQQQLEQERSMSLHKNREEEEKKGVRQGQKTCSSKFKFLLLAAHNYSVSEAWTLKEIQNADISCLASRIHNLHNKTELVANDHIHW